MESPYSPLDRSRKEIRTIGLQPSSDPGAPVICVPRTVSLLDRPTYTALSYRWGEPSDTANITFDARPSFSIPRNLDAALRQLRHPTEVTTLWADAICINQDENEPEKNQQVAMMGSTYGQASSTVIWLGPEADNSDLAMDTISHLYRQRIWEISDNTLTTDHFEAIATLCRREWWTRVWMIQELLLSPNPIVMCGTKSAPIEAFIHLDDLRRGYHRPSGKEIDNASQPSQYLFKQNPFSQILHHYYSDKRRIQLDYVSLDEWMVVIDDFSATDPRDKVYGLLGVGTKRDRLALPPDYSPANTVANVYGRATAQIILQRQDLLYLQFNAEDVNHRLGLPTWCRDYSCDAGTIKERYVPFTIGEHEKIKFHASGMANGARATIRASQEQLFPKSGDDNWRELHVRGWEIDEVVYTGLNPYLLPYAGNDMGERLANNAQRAEQTKSNVLKWEAEARSRLAARSPYEPKTVDDVFWRVPMADATFSWNPVPDDWKEYFNGWLDRAPLPSQAAELAETDAERKKIYMKPWTDPAITRAHGRTFIITKKGYLGLAPRKTQVGDVVSVLRGGHVPFILRKKETEGHEVWEFVGESFVLGLMEGQGAGMGEETGFVFV